MESSIECEGRGIANINCKQVSLTTILSCIISHSLLVLMNYEMVSVVSIEGLFVVSIIFAKLSLAHQLSNQKLILVPSPTFYRIPFLNCGLFFRIHFHVQESGCLVLALKKAVLTGYFTAI